MTSPLDGKVSKFGLSVDTLHEFLNAPDGDIDTENGLLPNLRKLSRELKSATTGAIDSRIGDFIEAVDQAEQSAARSEAGATASLAGGSTYGTTEQGLAATGDGQQFLLRTADPQVYDVYVNTAGVATPSGMFVVVGQSSLDAIRKLIDDGGDPNDIILPITDEDGWVWGGFFGNGSLQTPGFHFKVDNDGEFLIVDEDGWVIFDARDGQGGTVAAPPEPWAGKRFVLFGDSITQTGDPDNGNLGQGFRANWPNYAYGALQMASLRNYARSGAAFREYGQLDWQKISHQINQSIANGETPDVIVVSAGTNDGPLTLGDYDTAMSRATLGDLNRYYTIEAMRWAFWRIREAYPHATCFAALPIQRADAETADRQALLDAITRMAKRYNFILIDAHHESGIVKDFEIWPNPPGSTATPGRDLYDGIHPLASGVQKLGRLFVRVIRNAFNF